MPSAEPDTTETTGADDTAAGQENTAAGPEDTAAGPEDTAAGPEDTARQSLLEAITSELGDAVVGHHLIPGRDLWVRVEAGAWADTADYLRNRQRFRFFDWLSAVDWLPSPYGRSHDAEVDVRAQGSPGDGTEDTAEGSAEDTADPAEEAAEASAPEQPAKVAGGDTRFQVMARVYNLATGIGLHVKADVGDDLTVPSWIATYPGASWHEREANEMFGISFAGHPDLRNLYLPGDFEGHPLRKDFPLLARLIKPWPGIVDVEPMPSSEETP